MERSRPDRPSSSSDWDEAEGQWKYTERSCWSSRHSAASDRPAACRCISTLRKMILLPGLIFILLGKPGRCLEDGGFIFDGDIRHFAVASNTVYVVTNETLYHLSNGLTLIQTLTQRGILNNEKFYRVSDTDELNATFSVNVLLPFEKNGTVVSCGVTDNECGYCEVLDLKNISNVWHKENYPLGPVTRSSASVAFLVDVERSTKETYILAANQQHEDKATTTRCVFDSNAVRLHNTNEGQTGGIFSDTDDSQTPSFNSKDEAGFVDGFQIGSIIYLLSNVRSKEEGSKVRLIWFEGKTSKTRTLQSRWGVSLDIFDGGDTSGRLLASSVVPPGGPSVLWSGVFSVDGGPTNTELVMFDITSDISLKPGGDPDFCASKCDSKEKLKTLKPKKVLLRQNHMTSVLAERHKTWMLFFIGTGDGQLIKLAVDKNYHTNCPMVLYRANDDRKVLPKILLDEVDRKHVYVAFQNQMKRVPVSRCSAYKTLQDCWSAQDPYCVWCGAKRCTVENECPNSDWLSIPDDYQQKMVSYNVVKDNTDQITINVQTHLTAGEMALSNFACEFSMIGIELFCSLQNPPPQFPQCTCILSNSTLPAEGLAVSVRIRFGMMYWLEKLTVMKCTEIRGPPTPVLFPVWKNTGVSLMFHIPRTDIKSVVKVCVLLPDHSCHGNIQITYRSLPSCTSITPNSSWISGKRKITLIGSQLEFVEGVIHRHALKEVRLPLKINSQVGQQSCTNLTYDTPAAINTQGISTSMLSLKVANETLDCSISITYYPDPIFINFTSTRTGESVRITIEKTADKLGLSPAELSVHGIQEKKPHKCIMESPKKHNQTNFFICQIRSTSDPKFQQLKITYGDQTVTVMHTSFLHLFRLMLLVLLLIPCIIGVVAIVYRAKQKKLTARMNKRIENLELDIRNDIRQGFVDLQTEQAELMENVGAIPFLDYKHFASRIFFPENEALLTSCIKDISQVMFDTSCWCCVCWYHFVTLDVMMLLYLTCDQDAVKVQLDECYQGLSRLIQDQLFLTSMVHALEEQKTFTIKDKSDKDKCALASLLTVVLHSKLLYLTEVMEALLKALMQQSINTQPKMLLRRTESTVEKLLTNWMSICLYGFLRESVGQHMFLMVSALTQHIAKGPVDYVTGKALYTLSEDWLLWQAQDFSTLKLKVLFAVGGDGEVSEPLEVYVLNCDTVEQVKGKILSTFKAKFGFAYNTNISDAFIEFEKDGSFVPLEQVDASSEVIQEMTMINTLKHYKVPDGATIKVLSKTTHPSLSPQMSLTDDANFSRKYFHLIDPDVDEDQTKNPERKKLKLKEVHLTKLLSTKVAVHSFVENLFRSIWGTPQGKVPHAVKYFFDFLDTQAENMKITDPDVLHIWKTNSLPLRFWINILKNPQFVFDMEKAEHLDGCLSVIAQAFMDSFSLSENQLGKHTPTNKLLYAKDIIKFKQEVKAYYKQVRNQPPVTNTEFKAFLQEESKKHVNEFNEAAALRELFKFIQKYFTEIKEKLGQNGAPHELTEQLHHVKSLFDGLRSCSWT
ncbi:hypothetical protein PAMP_014874 [Pampus punctatissimus]